MYHYILCHAGRILCRVYLQPRVRKAISFSLLDMFKRVDDLRSYESTNLAQLTGALLARGTVPLATLQHAGDLERAAEPYCSPKIAGFWRLVMSTVLRACPSDHALWADTAGTPPVVRARLAEVLQRHVEPWAREEGRTGDEVVAREVGGKLQGRGT